MDSTAYLTKQGWRGSGHSLHPSGRGITKPLLVAKKHNTLGVGKKKVDVHGDQWWNRAFDSGLKSLKVGKDHAESDTKRESTALDSLMQARKHGLSKWGGLYGSFVKGDTLSGTLTPTTAENNPSVSSPRSSHKAPGSESGEACESAKKTAKKQKRHRDSEKDAVQVHAGSTVSSAARKEKKKSKASKRRKSSA